MMHVEAQVVMGVAVNSSMHAIARAVVHAIRTYLLRTRGTHRDVEIQMIDVFGNTTCLLNSIS